jgi:hypothetical protein
MARIGYARVSTLDQGLASQVERLRAEGCEIIRSEKVSGASRDGRSERAISESSTDCNVRLFVFEHPSDQARGNGRRL